VRIKLFIMFLMVFFFIPYAIADEICPNIKKLPAPSGAEELKMDEREFNFEHAISSIAYLEKDVYDILKTHGATSVLDAENFYISYPNSIKFVKGTLLRQEALLAKEKLEVAKLKASTSKGSNESVIIAEKAYHEAKEKFCMFLKSAEYVD